MRRGSPAMCGLCQRGVARGAYTRSDSQGASRRIRLIIANLRDRTEEYPTKACDWKGSPALSDSVGDRTSQPADEDFLAVVQLDYLRAGGPVCRYELGLDSNLFSVHILQFHSDSSCLPICPDCRAVGANEVVKKRCTVSSGWMLRCALARMRAPSSAASSTDACSSAVDLGLPNLIKVSRTESCH